MTGRIEAAVRYSDAGQTVVERQSRRGAVRHRGHARRCVPVTSASPNGRSSGAAPSSHAVATPHASRRACLVIALAVAGSPEEAMAAADGLIDAAEATAQPVCALVRASRLRLRLPRRRSRRALEAAAPGPGDRPRQRQPLQRNTPGDRSGPTRSRTRRPAGRARLPRLAIRNYHDSGNVTDYAIAAGCPRRAS